MFVVYETVPAEKIRQTAKEIITQIADWFTANPKRRVCHAQLWYGRTVTIKRKTIEQQVNEAAEEAIQSDAENAARREKN